MSLPQDARGAVAGEGSDFFRPQKGSNKVLIVGDVMTGYEYWTGDNKAFRSKEVFETTPGIRQVKKKAKDGTESMVDDKQKFFWAMPVYDYADQQYKIWQVSQKKLRDQLLALQNNEDWGDPVGKYAVSITREGEDLLTVYTVQASPNKDGIAEIVAGYQPIDVEKVIFG